MLHHLLIQFLNILPFKAGNRHHGMLGEGAANPLRSGIGQIYFIGNDDDREFAALDDPDHHDIDLQERVLGCIKHLDNAVDILPEPVHRFCNTLGCFAGAGHRGLLVDAVFQEIFVIDLGRDPGSIHDIYGDIAAV